MYPTLGYEDMDRKVIEEELDQLPLTDLVCTLLAKKELDEMIVKLMVWPSEKSETNPGPGSSSIT